MASVQERLQMKREPLDKWSIREQLCLASAVARSGDQNWMSVSRALKPFGEPNRPTDWFHQKNCAAQYGMLLAMVETPKRKKRATSVDSGIETPAEHILKKLQAERLAELKKHLAEEKAEYQKLYEDLILLQSGQVNEEQLDVWCKEIDEEDFKKEQEALAHAQYLKEREQRKQEIERAWRPSKLPVPTGQKRKNSGTLDNLLDSEQLEEIQQLQQIHQQQIQHQQQLQHQQLQLQQNQQPQELPKPALSPLLTSLLKSPSQVQSTSILHTAITNRHVPNTNTNPMIASLLNSTTAVPVSPGIQQLVSTAIGQNQELQETVEEQNTPLGNDILDDTHLTNLKLDDLANSILVQDGPLPEIKKEEVDDIISEIIENARDIVDDPEQHLQLDGNGDININLELSDFDEDEIGQETQSPPKEDNRTEQIVSSNNVEENTSEQTQQQFQENPQQNSQQPGQQTIVDPFEFQDEPIVFEPSTKPSGSSVKQDPHYVPHYQQQQLQLSQSTGQPQQNLDINDLAIGEIPELKQEEGLEKVEEESVNDATEAKDSKEKSEDPSRIEKPRGSVEIVEVTLTEDEESEKDFNKSQIEDIVQVSKQPVPLQDTQIESVSVETVEAEEDEDDAKVEQFEEDTQEEKLKTEPSEEETTTTTTWTTTTESKESVTTSEEINEISEITTELKKELNQDIQQDSSEPTVTSSEFTDDMYNEINVEITVDKLTSLKRDYSRSKKKEEKDFEPISSNEKSQLEDSELHEEAFSDNTMEIDKKDVKPKIKPENERSSSPWTEEEDNSNRPSKRRYSTPATPVDSVPNSPASSNAFYDDDREYRNWKKSVMLVYNRLATNRYASLFLKPITEDQAPGYASVVYRPMDLQTIKKNIENGSIRTTLEFKRDVMLMFTNAVMYNKTNDFVYNLALQMQQESLQPIEILLQAQQGEVSLRRETRTSESGIKRKRTLTDELLKVKKKKDD